MRRVEKSIGMRLFMCFFGYSRYNDKLNSIRRKLTGARVESLTKYSEFYDITIKSYQLARAEVDKIFAERIGSTKELPGFDIMTATVSYHACACAYIVTDEQGNMIRSSDGNSFSSHDAWRSQW